MRQLVYLALLLFVAWPWFMFAVFQWYGVNNVTCRSINLLKKASVQSDSPTIFTKNLTSSSSQPCKDCWYNWLNFSSTPCQKVFDPLKCASDTLSKSWEVDQKKTQYLRNLIESAISSNTDPFLTKKNTQLNSKIRFGKRKYKGKFGLVNKVIYNSLIKDSPFKVGKLYKTCSVVGGSSILLNSSCGKEIDESEFVFRCNTPPLKPFSQDAGTKSNLSTVAPISFMKKRYSNFESKKMENQFLADMEEYREYLWLPAFAIPSALDVVEKLIHNFSASIEKENRLKIVIQNPDQMFQYDHFFNKFTNFKKDLSSGLYMAMWALTLCEETTLYGFWPFPKISNDKNSLILPYHYYDKLDWGDPLTHHSMTDEFQFLLKLHQVGVLKIQHGKCKL